MFPTTIWDVVRDAGEKDPDALQRFAGDYRRPVLDFIRSRGVAGHDAEDLCQEVFVRLLARDVLKKADAQRGRFRSLLATITARVVIDWHRKKKARPSEEIEPVAPEKDFDQVWALHLTERALESLRESEPRHFAVLERHLGEEPVDRHKLWLARKKLIQQVRREIALTCRSKEEIEDEVRVLSPYLRPRQKS